MGSGCGLGRGCSQAGVSHRVPANGPTEDSHQPFQDLSGLWSCSLHSCLHSQQQEGVMGVQLLAFCWTTWGMPDCSVLGVQFASSGTSGRWWWFSCQAPGAACPSLEEWEALCQPKAEEGPSLPPSPAAMPMMVRPCCGAERGDAGCRPALISQKVPFISAGAWTGLCFGEGEVLLWVTIPSTFSSCSHLNQAVFSRWWRPRSSTELPQAPPSYCRSLKPLWPIPMEPGRLSAPTSPPLPCWSAGGGGAALL